MDSITSETNTITISSHLIYQLDELCEVLQWVKEVTNKVETLSQTNMAAASIQCVAPVKNAVHNMQEYTGQKYK